MYFAANETTIKHEDVESLTSHSYVPVFIDAIKQKSRILPMCTVHNIKEGRVSYPISISRLKAKIVSEGEAVETQKPLFKSITLTPKFIRYKVVLTYEAATQGGSPLVKTIESELNQAVVNKIEDLILYGNKTPDMKGITNSGAQTASQLLRTPSYENACKLLEYILKKGYDIDNAVFVVGNDVFTKLLYTKCSNENPKPLVSIEKNEYYLVGKKIIASHNMKANQIVFGDFSNVIVGLFYEGISIRKKNIYDGQLQIEAIVPIDIASPVPDSFMFLK